MDDQSPEGVVVANYSTPADAHGRFPERRGQLDLPASSGTNAGHGC
ncbi:hypothetical protein [Streptomyces sp. NPDC001068]